MHFGIWELMVILAIVALLFGTKKLGNIGADMGKAIKGFRQAMREEDDDGHQDKGKVIEGEHTTEKDKSA
jgi:sec-independent protein translocase protein TatA